MLYDISYQINLVLQILKIQYFENWNLIKEWIQTVSFMGNHEAWGRKVF